MLARMWSNRNSYSLQVGMQNGAATLENSLVLSYKTKDTLTTGSSNCAPWYLSKELKTYAHTKTFAHLLARERAHTHTHTQPAHRFHCSFNAVTAKNWE